MLRKHGVTEADHDSTHRVHPHRRSSIALNAALSPRRFGSHYDRTRPDASSFDQSMIETTTGTWRATASHMSRDPLARSCKIDLATTALCPNTRHDTCEQPNDKVTLSCLSYESCSPCGSSFTTEDKTIVLNNADHRNLSYYDRQKYGNAIGDPFLWSVSPRKVGYLRPGAYDNTFRQSSQSVDLRRLFFFALWSGTSCLRSSNKISSLDVNRIWCTTCRIHPLQSLPSKVPATDRQNTIITELLQNFVAPPSDTKPTLHHAILVQSRVEKSGNHFVH